MKLTAQNVRAKGTFLSSYHSDLIYIDKFQKHKKKHITTTEYVLGNKGMFKTFINEFRVARNIPVGNTHLVLNETIFWISSKAADDVDGFAYHLYKRNITREKKIMTSLASKILFLNNPWVLLPFDNLAKNSLKQRTNRYEDYLPKMHQYRNEKESEIEQMLSTVNNHLNIIEQDFKHLEDIKKGLLEKLALYLILKLASFTMEAVLKSIFGWGSYFVVFLVTILITTYECVSICENILLINPKLTYLKSLNGLSNRMRDATIKYAEDKVDNVKVNISSETKTETKIAVEQPLDKKEENNSETV